MSYNDRLFKAQRPHKATTRNRFEFAAVPTRNLWCWLFGHSLVNQGQYPGEMQRTIKCVRCGWSMHDGSMERPYQLLDCPDLDAPALTHGTPEVNFHPAAGVA